MRLDKELVKEFLNHLFSKRLGWGDVFFIILTIFYLLLLLVLSVSSENYKLVKLCIVTIGLLLFVGAYFASEFSLFSEGRNFSDKAKRSKTKKEDIMPFLLDLDQRLEKIERETSAFRMHLFSISLAITLTIVVALVIYFLQLLIPH